MSLVKMKNCGVRPLPLSPNGCSIFIARRKNIPFRKRANSIYDQTRIQQIRSQSNGINVMDLDHLAWCWVLDSYVHSQFMKIIVKITISKTAAINMIVSFNTRFNTKSRIWRERAQKKKSYQ